MPPSTYPETKLFFVERREESPEVTTYAFKPEEKVPFIPGQYGHLRLQGLPPEVRAVREFSFASAPHEELIEFGIDTRSGSEYQKRLASLVVGEAVMLFKIKNHLTWPPRFPSSYSTLGNPSEVVPELPPPFGHAVMIAGGVGVTPFRSMLRDKRHTGISARMTLLHIARGYFPYKEELSQTADTYLTATRDSFDRSITGIAAGHPGAHYYLAGSPAFVEDALKLLSQKGITRIEADPFKGLEE